MMGFFMAQEYYTSKPMVLPLIEGLCLAYEPFGSLQDIFKDEESNVLEIKGPVRVTQLVTDLKKETKEFTMLSYMPPDEHDALTEVCFKSRHTAIKLRSTLRSSIFLAKNKINFKRHSAEPIKPVNPKPNSHFWFIRLEFYLALPAEKFQLWFPHEKAYQAALHILQHPEIHRLSSVGKFKILQTVCQTNRLESQNANKLFIMHRKGYQMPTESPGWSGVSLGCDQIYRIHCELLWRENGTPQPTEIRIREVMGHILARIDFVLLIEESAKNSGHAQINRLNLERSFRDKFKEFQMFHETEYLIFPGLRTPFIMLKTGVAKDYRQNFMSSHRHFASGPVLADFKYLDGLKDVLCHCHSAVGRAGESSIPLEVCNKFKDILEGAGKSLHLQATSNPRDGKTLLQFYFSFEDKDATLQVRQLALLLSPVERKLQTQGVSVTEEMRREIEQEIFQHILSEQEDSWAFHEMTGVFQFSIYSQRSAADIGFAVHEILKSHNRLSPASLRRKDSSNSHKINGLLTKSAAK